MACCGGGDDREAAARNRQINAFLERERRQMETEVKLLLLGTGGSGKSTIAKQMKIIHLSGFTEQEKRDFRQVIYLNVVTAILILIKEADEPPHDSAALDLVRERVPWFPIKPDFIIQYDKALADAVTSLWADPEIKRTFARKREFQIDDSAPYFLDNCQRFCSPNYIPDEVDILRARQKTTGIVEIEFKVHDKKFKLVDVGGQRNERKKWIHCFQDVTSVIYCVAMNEYDLLLEEDGFSNRMHESLRVFEECVNLPFFRAIPIILFLNKKDLFEEKIKTVDPSCCFPGYEGGCDYEKASAYISKKFTEKNYNKNRTVLLHHTTATDTGNVRFVFRAVETMLLRQLMEDIRII